MSEDLNKIPEAIENDAILSDKDLDNISGGMTFISEDPVCSVVDTERYYNYR